MSHVILDINFTVILRSTDQMSERSFSETY